MARTLTWYDAGGRPLQQLPVDDRAAAVACIERWMKAPADKLPAHRITVETVTNPGTSVQVHVAYERAWKRSPMAPAVPS